MGEEAKAEHATTRKTKGNETDSLLQSCPPNTLTHGKHTHRHSTAERRAGEARGREEEQQQQEERETQWCSGITCVLAELRAHYPEHQHKEKEEEEEDKTRQDKTSDDPPAIPQSTHHDMTCTTITHHTKTHATTHDRVTVDSEHHRPSPLTQTITAIPQ